MAMTVYETSVRMKLFDLLQWLLCVCLCLYTSMCVCVCVDTSGGEMVMVVVVVMVVVQSIGLARGFIIINITTGSSLFLSPLATCT